MTDYSSATLRRRSFLAYCGGLGLGSGLFPGALWAQSNGGAEMMTAAAACQNATDFHWSHPQLK